MYGFGEGGFFGMGFGMLAIVLLIFLVGVAVGFLLGRARGWPLELTLARANEFAGAICAIPGAVPRDLGFYDKWMTRWR